MPWIESIETYLMVFGPLAVFVILFLDSLGVPLPTELSLLLAGYLVSTGTMSPLMAVLAGITGAVVGSSLAYRLGRGAGKTLVKKYGRYFRIGEAEMEKTTRWFEKHGEKAVLLGRFVPFVRNLVSYPAGTVGMAFGRFVLFTFLGYLGWIGASLYLGYAAGENWTLILAYIEELTWAAAGLAVVGGGAWYLRRRYVNGRASRRDS